MIATPRLAVDVVALDGVLDAALGVVVDVLGAANRIAIASGATAPFAVTLVSVGPSVRTGSGLRVETHARIGRRRVLARELGTSPSALRRSPRR